MFDSWKLAVVVATLIYGIMDFAAKVALGRGCRSRQLMLYASISVTLLALISLFWNSAVQVDWKMVLLYAMANSMSYGLGYIGQLETLRRLDANAAFPLVKTASAFAVLFGIFFLSEDPTFRQYGGILASFAVIAILFLEQRRAFAGGRTLIVGIITGTGAAVAHAISMTVGKVACTAVPIMEYIFMSYLMLTIWSLLLLLYTKPSLPGPGAGPSKAGPGRSEIGFGVFVGILNFVGYILILQAFARGPLSVVQPVFAMAFLIPTGLSVLVFKERFGPWRLAALGASMLSLWLILG